MLADKVEMNYTVGDKVEKDCTAVDKAIVYDSGMAVDKVEKNCTAEEEYLRTVMIAKRNNYPLHQYHEWIFSNKEQQEGGVLVRTEEFGKQSYLVLPTL